MSTTCTGGRISSPFEVMITSPTRTNTASRTNCCFAASGGRPVLAGSWSAGSGASGSLRTSEACWSEACWSEACWSEACWSEDDAPFWEASPIGRSPSGSAERSVDRRQTTATAGSHARAAKARVLRRMFMCSPRDEKRENKASPAGGWTLPPNIRRERAKNLVEKEGDTRLHRVVVTVTGSTPHPATRPRTPPPPDPPCTPSRSPPDDPSARADRRPSDG